MNLSSAAMRTVAGPFFDDLTVDDRCDGAPGVAPTEGRAAALVGLLA